MILRQNLEAMLTKLEQEHNFVTVELTKCPKGQLMKSEGKDFIRYFQVVRENGKRIRKGIGKQPDIIAALARKKYLETQLHMIEIDMAVIQKALQQFTDITANRILQALPGSYQSLPQEYFFTKEAVAETSFEKWQSEPFVQSDYMPEGKIHLSSRGLAVRSKSELLLVEKFYEFGVSFRYEQVLKIGKYAFAPDFTILSATGDIFYWEHCGLPGNQAYMKKHKWKLEIYESAGIVPWKNLIVTYDKEDGTIDIPVVESEIRNKLL